MEEMEQKLGAILNNPQMMQQIMAMAQSLGQSAPASTNPEPQSPPQLPQAQPQQSAGNLLPDIDLGTIQKLSNFARNSGIDKEQQALLHALRPYLSRDRVNKLEKAMRAAKMAKFASAFLGTGGHQFP